FQRPGRSERRKKGPDHARGLRTVELVGSDSCLRLLRCDRLQGLSYAALAGSRGIVALRRSLSTGTETDELALAGLHDGAVEGGGVDLVAGGRDAVALPAALVDLAAPVAARVAEALLQERREIDLPVDGRERRVGHVVRGLVLPHDPREMRLARTGAVLAVPA